MVWLTRIDYYYYYYYYTAVQRLNLGCEVYLGIATLLTGHVLDL
jgi:hypothetical protein